MTDDLRERLQAALGATYLLDRELGGGGMSRVFTATDGTLGRTVVVKILPPELAAGVSTERFKREISVAARLQHPHIVPLHSAGEMGGVPWFTMPFVEGESLRARLTRRGELPINESVRILREIASALAYAHEHGVVHRDIKPDNVLFSGDVAMVADFGVAKALSAATDAPSDDAPVTSLGVALGTPAYMAPEQATADPSTDHRADIYAFGVLAYEMLTGQPPFAGRNPSQLLAAHVTEPPEAIGRRRTTIPPTLAALVMRCLEKRPADRPQRASEIVHALDDIHTPTGGTAPTFAPAATASVATPTVRNRRPLVLALAAVAVAAIAVSAALWSRRPTSVPPEATDGSAYRIAVLPFENLGDSSDAYFADGITDAVRGKLTSLANLQVIARASSAPYHGTSKTPAEIARELGVRYLLTGTVRWAKNASGASHVQVSPELVEITSDGTASNKWQQPFDAEMADVFRVQGEIAGKVASAMSVAVGTADEARLVEVPTRDPDAYDAFLRAEAGYWRASSAPAELREVLAEYERAIGFDSSYAAAWVGVSRTASLLYSNAVPTPALARQARTAADRVRTLAPGSVMAHTTRAMVSLLVDQDATGSLSELEKARALSPNDPDVLARMAGAYLSMGRFDDALRSISQSLQLDPKSIGSRIRQVGALTWLRRYPEAVTAAENLFALTPSTSNLQALAMAHAARGDLSTARRVLRERATAFNPDEVVAYVATFDDLAWVLDDAQQQRALALSPELFDGDRGGWALVKAQIHGWRRDATLARAWGDTAARAFAEQVRENPGDGQRHALLGLSLAYAGRKAEALAEGERGMELTPPSTGALLSEYVSHQYLRSNILLGNTDKALDMLEAKLAKPNYLSPGWLRIDPNFARLRGNPRFEKLIATR